ncbi:MAG: hypothetical protein LUE99_17950 [Bacteroides sp.]|nr:hypothetical protein [Bacteroides sp.]
MQQMHAIGIPLNLDIIPYHGKVNGGHTYNSFIDENHQFIYFSPYEREPERNNWIAPLVQRVCYELQPKQKIKLTRWNGQLMNRTLVNVTSEYYNSRIVQIPIQVTDSIVYLATYNRGKFEVVAQGIVRQKKVFYPRISCGLLYFPMVGNSTGLFPAGNPFVVTKDSIRVIVPTQCSILVNGLNLYDIKKVLKLDAESYTLLYWENGWKPLKDITPTDSYTLNFGKVPIKTLFLLHCNTYMGRMQRPFLIENGKPVYY